MGGLPHRMRAHN